MAGALVTFLVAVVGFIRKMDDAQWNKKAGVLSDSLATARKALDSVAAFQHFYTVRFSDKATLQKILPPITQEHFDGIVSTEEAMECLLWQAKSQNGFVEFLKGDQSVVLLLKPDSTTINFDWQHRPNVLVTIFQNLRPYRNCSKGLYEQ